MTGGEHRGGIVAYVTSHGFGHLNRAVAVLNLLPPAIPLTIRSDPSLFPAWGERLRRPARLQEYSSDVGALNPPGDSAATDGPLTLARAAEAHARAMLGVDAEADRLRSEGTAAVLCDVPPVPLVAAARARVPSYLLANFTWADIYAPHARKIGPDAMATVRAIRDAYRHATTVLRAQPSLEMTGNFGSPYVADVGMVVTPGVDRRDELRASLGLAPSDRLVYFYIGRYGQHGLGWDRLAKLEGVHFVGFHPAPSGPMANLHVVDPTRWTGADLAASADAIVAKAGYGTACEAMSARTPLIYPPRVGFAEHRALDRALRAWGGGIPASARDFSALKVEKSLEKAFALRPGPPPFPADGAKRAAWYLVEHVEYPGKSRPTNGTFEI